MSAARSSGNVEAIEMCNACEIRNVLSIDMVVLCQLHRAAPAMREALAAFVACVDTPMSGSVFDKPLDMAKAALAAAKESR